MTEEKSNSITIEGVEVPRCETFCYLGFVLQRDSGI